jgi:uncharacterized protein (DUF433 family)
MAKARTKAREIAPGITVDPAVRFGKPVIKGRRVDVATVLGHLAAGNTVEEVMQEYRLTRAEILSAIGYAAEIVAAEEVLSAG